MTGRDPSESHAWTAEAFTRRVLGVAPDGWDAPAPVEEWVARDVVRHLVEWDLLDDPATAERVLANPHLGEVPLPEAVDRFYTADVFMHTWDLARATGQDERLDEDRCRELYEGMVPLDDVLRASGQYGPKVPVPDDADVQTKLLGFIGRRP